MIDRMVLFQKLSLDLLGEVVTTEEVGLRLAVAWSEVTDPNYVPTAEQIEEFSILRQLDAVFCKEVPKENSSLVEDAISQLIRREEEMRSLNLSTPWRSEPWFPAARHYCHQVLPPVSWLEDEIADSCRFGSGATHSGKGPVGRHLLSKVGGTQTVTSGAIRYIGEMLIEHFPMFYSNLSVTPARCVPGNRIAFVPKDKRKVRQIAIEPSLNMFLQQGIGRTMFSLLKKHGVDLRDQSRNRELAKEGSISGKYATIDLSDASSRICCKLVEDLLPPDWYELLSLCRSPYGLLPNGEHIRYHSFSTQGNAFTFPLETLIFKAVLWSSGYFESVYGDDIIIKSKGFLECVGRLTSCGFLVNTEKSYASGSFRESCGGDYVNGLACRPVYYRESAKADSELATYHNLLFERWGPQRLVRTLPYIRGRARTCLRGPSAFVSGDITTGDRPIYRNYLTHPYSWWFWQENWEPGDIIVKNSLAYTKLRRYKFVPSRLRHKSTNFSKYLTFLYGGTRSILSSSIGKERIVGFNLHVSALLPR